VSVPSGDGRAERAGRKTMSAGPAPRPSARACVFGGHSQ
jgi:hypothetical protein